MPHRSLRPTSRTLGLLTLVLVGLPAVVGCTGDATQTGATSASTPTATSAGTAPTTATSPTVAPSVTPAASAPGPSSSAATSGPPAPPVSAAGPTSPAASVPASAPAGQSSGAAPTSSLPVTTAPATGPAQATPPAPPAGLTPVPPVAVTTAAPVAPTATATASTPAGRLLVDITAVRSVKTAGQGPGEIAGQPAIAVTLAIRNQTRTTLDLGQISVTAAYGATATPAVGSSGPPSKPFTGVLRPGSTGSAVLVFRVPVAERGRVDLAVDYLAGAPVVLFRGRVG